MVKMRAIAMQSALNVDRRATTNYIVKLPYIAQTVQALMQLSQKIAQHGGVWRQREITQLKFDKKLMLEYVVL